MNLSNLVTPHPKRGHNTPHPTRCLSSTPPSSPPQCSLAGTRHALSPHPPDCQQQPSTPPGARAKEGSPRQGPGTPPTPQPNPRGAPACWPPKHTHSTPSCTKQTGRLAGQPLHQSVATSQSTPHIVWPRPPCRSLAPHQRTELAPKPGTEIQENPSDPERAETPAPDNPQDPNPSPDPEQKARSLSWPQTPDGKQ
ncbi:hypothetical protein ILYODFUR_033122 [Ilyodon furcidens]|uniref:Uncharacterized protein n=1 Tax=Ilyodon furcidens TaxID=33524 RepID=A0ABV0TZT8_9TELE